jgi:hypothetical protein
VTTGKGIQQTCQIADAHLGHYKGVDEFFATGMCMGFVSAILRSGGLLDQRLRFCVPERVTGAQAVKVLLKFLNDHPADTNRAAETLAITAFIGAWPCK